MDQDKLKWVLQLALDAKTISASEFRDLYGDSDPVEVLSYILNELESEGKDYPQPVEIGQPVQAGTGPTSAGNAQSPLPSDPQPYHGEPGIYVSAHGVRSWVPGGFTVALGRGPNYLSVWSENGELLGSFDNADAWFKGYSH